MKRGINLIKMKNITFVLLLFTTLIFCHFSTSKAVCRRRNASKFKRSLKLAISSDDINNRHKAGLRKVFRQKRFAEIDDDVPESHKFFIEIKFLEKWNQAMDLKDGSAYRLFQGNVLDAILEQLNSDQKFLDSKVLDLRKASDGILAKVAFQFRKSEHNPLSHVRFIVSHGHISSLKVDENYLKILKIPDNLFKEESFSEVNPTPNPSQDKKITEKIPSHIVNYPPSLVTLTSNSTSSQNQRELPAQSSQSEAYTATFQTKEPLQNLTFTQNQKSYSSQTQPENLNFFNDASYQDTLSQNQKLPQIDATPLIQETPHHEENTDVNTQQTPGLLENAANVQDSGSEYSSNGKYDAQQPSYQYNNDDLSSQTASTNTKVGSEYDSSYENDPQQRSYQNYIDDLSSEAAPASTTASIVIKINQAWYSFLGNHDSPQYKMLAGNFEKGLTSVLEDDANIEDVKVTDLMEDEKSLTNVEFSLKFVGAKEASIQRLKEIVNDGDIAGISVDKKFFKVTNDPKNMKNTNKQM